MITAERRLDAIRLRLTRHAAIDELFMVMMRDTVADLLTVVESAQRIVEWLAQDDCQLDHHGDCQAHNLSAPCPVPAAKAALDALVIP